MTLAAHTNAVGTHHRNETVFPRISGREDFDYDNVYRSYDYVYGAYARINDVAYRTPIVRGDRVNPTPMHRIISRVIENAPYTHRSTLYSGGGKVVYDETYEVYITQRREPFQWLPWNDGKFQNAHDESVVKALNNLAQAKAQLGAELAMIRQTADMFADNASKLANALIQLKRGRWRGLHNTLGFSRRRNLTGKSVSDAWLEAQYGWLPLMGSIRDTQSLLHSMLDKPKLLHGRGTGKYEGGRAGSYDWYDYSEKYDGRVRTHLTASVDSSAWHNLDSAGLINPLSIAWELVPWSFAIDWFVPVGATLEALTATAGLSFVRGYQTSHHKYRIDLNANVRDYGYKSYNGYADGFLQPGAYTEQRYDFRRWTYSAFPKPVFYADITPFSTPRVLNALALVRQLFR